MSATIVGKCLAGIGVLLILHAGYYTVQYEGYVALSDVSDAMVPPIEALIELTVAYVLTLIGVLMMAGPVKPIRSTDYMCSKVFDSVNSVPDFYIFNHRGKSLHRRLVSS